MILHIINTYHTHGNDTTVQNTNESTKYALGNGFIRSVIHPLLPTSHCGFMPRRAVVCRGGPMPDSVTMCSAQCVFVSLCS